MSFPNVIYGNDPEQYNTYTTKRWPLGTQMVFQDGRRFRFVKAGGTALVIGNVIQAPANVANHVDLTAVASALGSNTPTVTLGNTAATLDQYAEGYAVVSVTPDAGHAYKIKSNPAADGLATLQLTLENQVVLIAAWTTTSRVDLIANPCNGVIQTPITTLTGAPMGVAVAAIAASSFGWIQFKGIAAVLTANTISLGGTAWTPGTVAGACEPIILVEGTPNTWVKQSLVGVVQRVAASTAWSALDLRME